MEHQTGTRGKNGTPAVTEAFERFFHSQVNGSGDVITDAGGSDRDYFYAGVNFLL